MTRGKEHKNLAEIRRRQAKVIVGLKRVSKPGLRVYASRDDAPRS